LGFQNILQKPKYIIKTVRENNQTNFIDEKGCKRDRTIVRRKYKYQNEIEYVNFDRKYTSSMNSFWKKRKYVCKL